MIVKLLSLSRQTITHNKNETLQSKRSNQVAGTRQMVSKLYQGRPPSIQTQHKKRKSYSKWKIKRHIKPGIIKQYLETGRVEITTPHKNKTSWKK
jgi:hypothetical protein